MTATNGTLEPLTTKAKIGLVVVSTSTVSELRYPRAVPEVGFLASRMMLGGDQGLEALLEMEKSSGEGGAGAGLGGSGLHRLLLHGEPAPSGDWRRTGSSATTWSGDGVRPSRRPCWPPRRPLQHLGIHRVVLTSPYPHSYHEAESRYLAEAGIETVAAHGMGLQTAAEFAAVPPGEIYRFALGAWRQSGDGADGLFISCMNFDAMAAAQALEEVIGKPVVTSHSATLWRALALAGIDEPVHGYGRLLSEPREHRATAMA